MKKNKRTLKKRIRRVMSLSASVTVVFLSSLIICLTLIASKEFAIYQADIICKDIQRELNSGLVNKNMGIESTDELYQDKELMDVWIRGISKSSILNVLDPFNSKIQKIFVQIEVKDEIVYDSYEDNVDEFTDFYSDTEAEMPINDSTDDSEIGSIKVRVNPQVIIPIVGLILIVILSLSIIALIVEKILSLFLTIPIINPLKQLETKVKALAEGDTETAMNTQIVLKRPLLEIESLADSTNGIMRKLHGYNELLESQKETLENQNAELEVQNEELIRSKQQIQEQQAQLVQSEKMASVGLLTAAITHEINTPIGAINSNAQLTDLLLNGMAELPNVAADEDLKSMLHQMKEVNDVNLMACSRIIEIIKSLKSFSRLDQAEFQEADINEGIRSVLVLTNNLLKRRITVHEEYGDIPPVRCFPGQLNQVFMNIIVNASQAIEGEGEIFIHTCLEERYIVIRIKDTGTGISPEHLNKIFEPGFTTKGAGIGLGIGLYISYNIIQNHNGEISVTSEPGKGTEFMMKIPIDNERT